MPLLTPAPRVTPSLRGRRYEHYNIIGRKVDARLEKLGGVKVGERGEGDDDKSMEEDYLAWKDGMFVALAAAIGLEEGGVGETPDFVVTEVPQHPVDKVFQGELSSRALLGTKGIHDAKNPFPAPVTAYRELFSNGERNCIHLEFDITGSGITYQHGDHVAVWPSNPDVEVERILAVLGLAGADKRFTPFQVVSLDPTLAKVPFPTPSTYDAVFRNYVDIAAVASRQTIAAVAKYAPTDAAREVLARLGSDKDAYHAEVVNGHLTLGEVLQIAAGNDITLAPTAANTTVWPIPFDHILSDVSRLQPRFYSISSSPKLYPTSIHVTAVVLKYESQASASHPARWVFGLGTNYLLNLKRAAEQAPDATPAGAAEPEHVTPPAYTLTGPRGLYRDDQHFKVPIHVRRSTFRLPTSPKIPVIMIGPGTVRPTPSRALRPRPALSLTLALPTRRRSPCRVLPRSAASSRSASRSPAGRLRRTGRTRSPTGRPSTCSTARATRPTSCTRPSGPTTSASSRASSSCLSPFRGRARARPTAQRSTSRTSCGTPGPTSRAPSSTGAGPSTSAATAAT